MTDVIALLGASELCRDLDDESLRTIAAALEWVAVRGSEVVLRQGEPGTDLFLVASGRLRVSVTDADGVERLIREVGRGENVGEMSLLTGSPRSATVRAVRDSVLLRLSRERFEQLAADHPMIVLSLTRILAGWLEASNQRRRTVELPTTIAVIAGSPDVPLEEFVARLGAALGAMGSVLSLRADDVDAAVHRGAADEAEGRDRYERVTRWLNNQEAAHRYVLYETDPARSAWSQRCIRQADRLLTVAWGNGRAMDQPLSLTASDAPTSLVSLHPRGTRRPTGTERTTIDRYGSHHHVRIDDPAHYGRLARHLAGRAVGLVLSGGGARGMAHLGVARALRELGVPIDRIGGTSIGANVGAMLAMEREPDEIGRLISDLWVRARPEREYTLPLISLLSGRAWGRVVRQVCEDMLIEDLWIPFFGCSADLTHSEIVIHRRGPLDRCVLASASIPGVAPPVAGEHGEILVDGGLVNNMPVDAIDDLGSGPVIAVDVSSGTGLSLDAWGGKLPTPLQVIRNRLTPFTPRRPYPTIFRILVGSSFVSTARHTRRMKDMVDLYLRPPVAGFDLMRWDNTGPIEAAGYEHAMERLSEWSDLSALAATAAPVDLPRG